MKRPLPPSSRQRPVLHPVAGGADRHDLEGRLRQPVRRHQPVARLVRLRQRQRAAAGADAQRTVGVGQVEGHRRRVSFPGPICKVAPARLQRARGAMAGDDRPLMRALRGETLPVPPVWLMRQAGRYLPEYRAVRAQAGSFLDLCYTPELAAEVTLQPIRRFGFDAAILFADILLVPQALGAELAFVEGEGPRLSTVDHARPTSPG